MDWLDLHKQSEELASQAHALLRSGDEVAARHAFAEAARAETDALAQVDPAKQKTLGITAVSATSLWFKAGDLHEAARLAHQMLASHALPDFAREQLDDILLSVYSEQEKTRSQVAFLPGSVAVSVQGGEVLRGAAPLDLIVERVKTIQALYYRVIEWTSKLPHRKHGGPPKEISDSFEPWLVQAPPGSFQFAVAIRKTPQLDLFENTKAEAPQLARRFLQVVKTVASDDDGAATKVLIPEDDYRQTFRKLVRNLAPSAGSFDALQLRSEEHEEDSIALRRDIRPKLTKVLRAEQPPPLTNEGEEYIEVKGMLRGLDLNRDWLRVDIDDRVVEIKGLSEAVDDIIGPMVNRPVVVRAIKSVHGQLRFVDIEPAQ